MAVARGDIFDCGDPLEANKFVLTLRSSGAAYGGPLTLFVSPANIQSIQAHAYSKPIHLCKRFCAGCLAFCQASPCCLQGAGCWCVVLWSFWPQVLIPPGLAALFFVACGLCLHAPFLALGLTRRSSRPAFCGRLT